MTMLHRDKKVLPFASLMTSLRLSEPLLAARFLAPSTGLYTSVNPSKNPPHFTNPTRDTLVQRVGVRLFTVLGRTQPHESLYAKLLA